MPTINQHIAAQLDAGDIKAAFKIMRSMDNDHDNECWHMYLSKADYFPAGGLWFSHRDFVKGLHPLASPHNMAYMLDNEGALPHDRLPDTARDRLPLRNEVTELTYHRKPTASEIQFGHGATHYRTFPVDECVYPHTRIAKAWFVADDGLRYYR